MMYDTVDTVYDCVRIATGVMSTLKIKPDRMLKGAMYFPHRTCLLCVSVANSGCAIFTRPCSTCGRPISRYACNRLGRVFGAQGPPLPRHPPHLR